MFAIFCIVFQEIMNGSVNFLYINFVIFMRQLVSRANAATDIFGEGFVINFKIDLKLIA